MLYIPFVIIDMVVASVLMSMGMMMLSPMIISLPFKLLLFVMVDGWTLLMTSSLKASYKGLRYGAHASDWNRESYLDCDLRRRPHPRYCPCIRPVDRCTQAATSIQEMTLSFIPKLMAVAVAIILVLAITCSDRVLLDDF